MIRPPATAILAALAFAGCGGGDTTPLEEADDGIRLAVLGQSLIEHDPRVYLDAPLATIIPILGEADVVFTNLEVAIAGPTCDCEATRADVYFHGAEPGVLDYLADIGVSLLALSNNHSWDFGPEGILSTIAEVEARGIAHAGTGADLSAASTPGYINFNGFRLGLVSIATVNLPDGAAATISRPGVNALNPGDSIAWERNLASVRRAKASADAVIVYQHFQIDGEEGWQERWARSAVDAGADLYVSHGEPELSGVEIYNGGLILYGLGNFIFHTRTELGRYPPEVWQSVVVQVDMGRGGVRGARFIPIALDPGTPGPEFLETRGYPEVARGTTADSILDRLQRLSRPYGTSFRMDGGVAFLVGTDTH